MITRERNRKKRSKIRNVSLILLSVLFSATAVASDVECDVVNDKDCRHKNPAQEDNVFVRPTISPAPTITSAPSQSPGPTATHSPSQMPSTESPTRTLLPTTSPFPTISASPTIICTVENGFYGSRQGIATIVDYYYQLETTPGTVEETVNDEIAPATEREISNIVLPILFPEECDSPLSRRLQATQTRHLALQGFSSRPLDQTLAGTPCQVPQEDAGNDCYLVDGAFTIVSDSVNLKPGLEDSIQQLLESAMNSGAFDTVDDRVVKITYIPKSDVTDLIPPPVSGGQEQETDAQTTGTLPIYAWALIGVGAAGVSVMLYYVAATRRKKQQDEKTALVAGASGSFEQQGASHDVSYSSDGDNTIPTRNY